MEKTLHPILEKLEIELEDIASQWDGDQAGAMEDAASAASDGLEAIKELKSCLEELGISY